MARFNIFPWKLDFESRVYPFAQLKPKTFENKVRYLQFFAQDNIRSYDQARYSPSI